MATKVRVGSASSADGAGSGSDPGESTHGKVMPTSQEMSVGRAQCPSHRPLHPSPIRSRFVSLSLPSHHNSDFHPRAVYKLKTD